MPHLSPDGGRWGNTLIGALEWRLEKLAVVGSTALKEKRIASCSGRVEVPVEPNKNRHILQHARSAIR